MSRDTTDQAKQAWEALATLRGIEAFNQVLGPLLDEVQCVLEAGFFPETVHRPLDTIATLDTIDRDDKDGVPKGLYRNNHGAFYLTPSEAQTWAKGSLL